ncbi:Catalase-peroxidase [Wickerhamomyces ciferrii]|uniref:Peroxidase n=1 Tax=Wickerhamomyces ciferrii (strain ATCC 14091 / BCRC 22168 / CBS 111 / JCM 3599 / NBRC 0793 / NRRL Y-1031 F-60-10) TaxID=1206466 RepID=K0KSK3_WICCF|nr:Catalase-peroxidase [Wickerhamomyces ciferrii]CCH45027.1 Catalase-peroxidase [Wickerhamomyces ciferrii]
MSATKIFNRNIVLGGALLSSAFITNELIKNNNSSNTQFLKFSPINNQNSSPNDNHKHYGKALIAGSGLNAAVTSQKSEQDYQKLYNAIAEKLRDNDEYDEYIGFGPALVRLAWHLSGTYAQPGFQGCPHQSGGSFGGTIREGAEAKEPANNGLQNPRKFLEEFHDSNPWISYGDLYTLGGVVAIQEMGGPKIGWRYGRVDQGPKFGSTSRLPDASQDADYVRNLFARMGFNDREVVSLIGAHALGSCHVLAPAMPGSEESTGPGSGFTGRWTASPNFMSSEFFRLLLEDKWEWKNWDGPRQYVNKDDLMMLPTDYALIQDESYLKWVKIYAYDQERYFKDFAKDFQKLLELGIEFPKETKTFYFKTLDDQEL